ncbi:MAG: type II CAAX endopeptidase family protein [Pyrinomonadaceae bacterium]
MKFEKAFFNEYGRLRSGWRFGFFLALCFLIGFPLQILTDSILLALPVGYSDQGILHLVIPSAVSLAVVVLAGWFCGKFFEDLPFRALGLWFTKKWFVDLLSGLVVGALTVSLAVLIPVIFGGLRFQLNESAGQSAVILTLGTSFLIFLTGAAWEEALFRGYMLQTFTRSGLGWFAIILTSVFFGAVHLGNPAAGLLSTVNTILAGVWFSAAYLKTRTLWFPIGLHFIWNWMMGAFYGIEVSGITNLTTAPLFREIDRGPFWLTGADYGLEGGSAATLALALSTLLIWFLPIFRPTEEMLSLTDREKPKTPEQI